VSATGPGGSTWRCAPTTSSPWPTYSGEIGFGRSYRRYAFTYVDQVHDRFLSLGIRSFVKLGFMPSRLASGSQTAFWWQGNVAPPADMREWVDLVQALVRHLVDRYGIEEVRRWPIEVWNEPNLDAFWRDADQDACFRLYEATARAVKKVDAALQVGGPAISPGSDERWAHAERRRTPGRATGRSTAGSRAAPSSRPTTPAR
jgi:beta-xylosidase